MPPPAPAAYPALDQLVYISGTYLSDPLVANALAYVQSVVPPALLNIKPSTQIQFGQVTYNDNANTNCYWGSGTTCKRATDTANFKADISACPTAGQWGLTFDDGPLVEAGSLGATDLRNALSTAGVKATMFAVGTQLSAYPDQLLAHYQAGHEIAVHTWTHRPCTNLTNAQLVAEIKYTERRIYEITGQIPQFFRPPYGDIDDRVRAIVSALGYRMVHWTTEPTSFDSEDTTVGTNQTLFNKIASTVANWASLPATTAGFITLDHEISNTTVALDLVMLKAIAAKKAAGGLGISPQPVGQCLGISAYRSASTAGTATVSATAAATATSRATSSTSATPSSGASASFVRTARSQLATVAFSLVLGCAAAFTALAF
ncbi:hypothetical protein BJ742DRAFT_670544 [Cladochytrium replicatum]|nr:hypothetical protein BJ742DRAFT_670544 [Cladochytrium replicatum]